MRRGNRASQTRAPVNRKPLTPFGLAPDEAEPLADSASGFRADQRASGNTSNNRRAGGLGRCRGAALPWRDRASGRRRSARCGFGHVRPHARHRTSARPAPRARRAVITQAHAVGTAGSGASPGATPLPRTAAMSLRAPDAMLDHCPHLSLAPIPRPGGFGEHHAQPSSGTRPPFRATDRSRCSGTGRAQVPRRRPHGQHSPDAGPRVPNRIVDPPVPPRPDRPRPEDFAASRILGSSDDQRPERCAQSSDPVPGVPAATRN